MRRLKATKPQSQMSSRTNSAVKPQSHRGMIEHMEMAGEAESWKNTSKEVEISIESKWNERAEGRRRESQKNYFAEQLSEPLQSLGDQVKS